MNMNKWSIKKISVKNVEPDILYVHLKEYDYHSKLL